MDFSEVIGQKEMKQRLLKMANDKHVPHALLLWTLRFRQNGFGDELRKLFA